MTELLCQHRWGEWVTGGYDFEEKPRLRKCIGLCGIWHREDEAEPEIIIAKTKDVA